MTKLDKETIDLIHKLEAVLETTTYTLNRFELFETGAQGIGVLIDIRKHEEVKE